MKLESITSFYQNFSLNREKIRILGISGLPKEDLASLAEFFLTTHVKKWVLPDNFVEMQQLSLITDMVPEVFLGIDKIKKQDLLQVIDYLKSNQNLCCLLSTSSSALQTLYAELKNEFLWLDLSQEKPWQKKDRYLFLIQSFAKKNGYQIDKQASNYLLDHLNEDIDQALARLNSCFLYAQQDKKISLQIVQELLPEAACELDFQWVDQLVFKKEPLELPAVYDASDLLLFLGQIRYAITTALKLKSLVLQHVQFEEMKNYFPKLSQQAFHLQMKKIEDVSLPYLEDALLIVHEKELELKQDFQQPNAVFIDLVSKITEKKLCQKLVN